MISIVVPTYNRADMIEDTVESLLKQEPGDFEIIVVDNNCTDDTASIVKRLARDHEQVTYVFEEAQGASNARNAGWRASSGDPVIFVDDDIIAPEGWLQKLVAYHEERDADAVGGRACSLFEGGDPPWFIRRSKRFSDKLGAFDLGPKPKLVDDYVITCNMSVRRYVLEELDGFGTWQCRKGKRVTGGGDVLFSWRILDAGYSIWWAPDAWLHHRVPKERQTMRHLIRLAFWDGVSGVAIGKRWNATEKVRRLPSLDTLTIAPFFVAGKLWGGLLLKLGKLEGAEAGVVDDQDLVSG